MPLRTKLQIATLLLATAGATVFATHSQSSNWLPFWLLLIAVLISSGLKVGLPGADGTMSLNFPFILLGIVQLSPLQAMLLAALSVAAQCRIRVVKMLSAVQIVFNVANAMLSTACAFYTFAVLQHFRMATAPALAAASVAYFLCSTVALALVLASSKGEKAFPFWRAEFPWYLPFYFVGAALAAMAHWMSGRFGWGTALLLLPVVYTLYRAYKGQLSRVQERQQHLEETEALHLRTIEGLAMAIEAKDQNTHDHLFRVRQYVKAVGQALKLSKVEMQALETAAFLHDIGKLAVPEHIINKPGKLTPEEFEKMKIHPVVGADILERVRFPYPVVPIVRSHHEWWNGTGYPDGLQGTDIPIGARILTVVDCFDALVSDRPYRKGMSGSQALNLIRDLSGRQFDPSVVREFELCHAETESRIEGLPPSVFTPLKTDVEVSRGLAPGAGYEAGSDEKTSPLSFTPDGDPYWAEQQSRESLDMIASASQEAQFLFELIQSVGDALDSSESVAVMASRLRRLIPFHTCSFYFKQGDSLELRFVDGQPAESFTAKKIQLGEGLSGWVAQSGKPILNGNAAAEPGCPYRSDGTPAFHSGLSIPLFDPRKEVFAVLSLYSVAHEAFSRDHLRILLAMESKVSLSLRNLLQPRQKEPKGETDFLTGLFNAKHFFLQLESELTLARKVQQPLTIFVCDLNGLKEVNEKRGYLAGNVLLRLAADAFHDLCGETEMVARIGGDEFALLLPGATEAEAVFRLEEVRCTMGLVSRRADSGLRLTSSLGAAFYPADGLTAEALISAAERRMQLAKTKSSNDTFDARELQAVTPVTCNG